MYILPIKHRKPMLYLTKCKLLTKDYKLYKRDVGGGDVQILPMSYCSIIFGLGTSITHGAIRCLAEHNTTAIWMSSNRGKFNSMSAGMYGNLFKQQLYCYSNPKLSQNVAFELFAKRFKNTPNKKYNTRQKLMGLEGILMSNEYNKLASRFGVENFIRDGDTGNINRHINILNSYLYGITEAVICSLKCSPHIGFIHMSDRAFVYDISDVFKLQTSIIFAFQNKENSNVLEVRENFINYLNDSKITKALSECIIEVLNNGNSKN